LAPFLGGFFVRSFVFFIFLRKRGYCNEEMNEAPSRSGKEENNSAWVSVYGKFWISWRPWVYGYRRRLSPNERDIVFETKPLISSIYVREREYHLLWKEISFLSHFHVRRRAIYNSFTLGNVCRTPSVLFSPSCFFPSHSSLIYAAFSFTPESRESFFVLPLTIFWLGNKTYRGIAWALF
jgi:hypothetical protein